MKAILNVKVTDKNGEEQIKTQLETSCALRIKLTDAGHLGAGKTSLFIGRPGLSGWQADLEAGDEVSLVLSKADAEKDPLIRSWLGAEDMTVGKRWV